MRVLISCAGREKLIGAVPNHLVEVDGVPLLHRTVSQVNAYGYAPYVVANNGDARYVVPGSSMQVADNSQFYGQGRFRSAQHLYSWSTRTVALLGDVYYSDIAVEAIIKDPRRALMMYGRDCWKHDYR